MTVLGYKKNPKKQKVEAEDSEDEPREEEVEENINNGLNLRTNFVDKDTMLWGLYYNPKNKEQQEIITVEPHTVKPVLTFD